MSKTNWTIDDSIEEIRRMSEADMEYERDKELEEQKWDQLLNDIKKTYLSLGGKERYFNQYSDFILLFLKDRVTPL